MKVLYAASEALPFIASGGLADVAGSLPQALRKRLVGCRVVMPLYDGIKQELKDSMKFITSISVPVAWRRQYCGIFEARAGGVIYYLLDNQYYFKRDALYGFYDDAERFAFFARAILEIIPHIDFKPDIIHCNDWQTALTPLYYSTMYANQPGYENIKTVLTIHNIQYQGVYGEELIDNVVGIDHAHKNLIEYDGAVNLMKAGIECANAVTTVSPSYAKEILDPWYSHGLDTILRERSYKLRGILNGIDVENYNPETDKDVFKNYSVDNMRGKAVNKRELQKLLGLPEKKDTPVMGMVTRLVSHRLPVVRNPQFLLGLVRIRRNQGLVFLVPFCEFRVPCGFVFPAHRSRPRVCRIASLVLIWAFVTLDLFIPLFCVKLFLRPFCAFLCVLLPPCLFLFLSPGRVSPPPFHVLLHVLPPMPSSIPTRKMRLL